MRAVVVLLIVSAPAFAQGPPKVVMPDDATRSAIRTKTAELYAKLKAIIEDRPGYADVAVYAKAGEWIERHSEYYAADAGKKTLAVLDAGLKRAAELAAGKTPWRDVRGRAVALGYKSDVDGSYQPYSVTYPDGFDSKRVWPVEIVLHGRDATLTEVKFLAARETGKAKPTDKVVIEVYGRGNNAYRWAGETDVMQVITEFGMSEFALDRPRLLDPRRRVIRGFSMGGAGTWHLGLHYPFEFAAMQPGAGFTVTRGYTKLPDSLPEYVEKCLHIYDAADYAENAFNIPVVAYSGEKDKQKAAADNIEARLRDFPEKVRFTHLVAPGLEHKQPPEWVAKADAELEKVLPRAKADRVRFVTYTPRYGSGGWVTVERLTEQYRKAVIDASRTADAVTVKTENVAALSVSDPLAWVEIDGQKVTVAERRRTTFVRESGRWQVGRVDEPGVKRRGLQGPIDDAFSDSFLVVPPANDSGYPSASLARFAREWDKYLRGKLPVVPADKLTAKQIEENYLVLFGDPTTNPFIAKVLPKLPITWTADTLIVNGVRYDPKTHVPVLIYPNPLNPTGYVVLNSGHTFHAADFEGTNALLYPRLGDWAVLRPNPTAKDPANADVVVAGLFDEKWQFPPTPVAPGAALEKVWGDGEFTEGPAEGPDGAIYFSDIGNRLMRYDPTTGKTTAHRDPSGRSNGLAFDAAGRLIACEGANTGGNRRVTATGKDGKVTVLADKWDGKRFNSPNDLAIDAAGRIYFSDPRYVGDEKREIDTESVYRIDPDGKVTRLITDVTKPNGLAVSADGKTLFVAETNLAPGKRGLLLAYPLAADGSVGAKKVIHEFRVGAGADGIKTTADGKLIVAVVGPDTGISVFAADGKRESHLPTPEGASNCCLAGKDLKTLYVTAGKSLYRVQVK